MFKVVHNTDVSFAKEAKKSELPVRIGLKTKGEEPKGERDTPLVYFYTVATAVVDGTVHEYWVLIDVVPSPFVYDEKRRAKIREIFERIANSLKEYFEKEGAEVLTDSFYEVVGKEV